ncbi:MAG TPA: lipid-A-disaccharide synthase N-terminal domain-containing protein [Dysgonamonadaceae bacterium]|nr:lipid-A-disaccharide synthase N-terminal domain-containing protein [Dysgonamonadaceae bacterium]HOV35563.1 lipid-A-disaccharide synthase N-terminal domain-containing protein [Dysgonamonadaceae bacterium]HQG07862.1 lipid-A-disaccharide synthase N-terminal domain-containing protein [Dysgonamonadaceae bacterium]HQI43733.1 lipid-A-disaccharide synthase N-terminal domain-containing protein [Dysgonamonadaceae bacterium]
MQSTPSWIFGVGLLAQLLFSARVLYQWIVTEKARKVLSPPAFWVLSIIGSYLLFIYGVLRDDFSIILGQFLSYYVYLWNLNMQKLWGKIAGIVKVMLLLTPVAAVAYMLRDPSSFNLTFFHNQDVPLWLLILGSTGQVIFSLRFVYQWVYGLIHHCSVLPLGFWIWSLIGSLIIIVYAFFRLDPVLILGQSFGFVAYIRNIMIDVKSKKISRNEE